MDTRKYGTCFFEQYAQITLAALLGHEFDDLVNRDRPDLQSADGHTLGIEVSFISAVLLSFLSALAACGASGVAGGS